MVEAGSVRPAESERCGIGVPGEGDKVGYFEYVAAIYGDDLANELRFSQSITQECGC